MRLSARRPPNSAWFPAAVCPSRGRQTRNTVLLAAALFLMCMLPSASVLIGQDAGDDEACLDQPARERIPSAGCLVREHEGHDSVRLERPAALGEDRCHSLLVVAMREGARTALAGEPSRIGDSLILLVGQPATEQLREQVTGSALEPDVEEIGQLGVHHVVVVRRGP